MQRFDWNFRILWKKNLFSISHVCIGEAMITFSWDDRCDQKEWLPMTNNSRVAKKGSQGRKKAAYPTCTPGSALTWEDRIFGLCGRTDLSQVCPDWEWLAGTHLKVSKRHHFVTTIIWIFRFSHTNEADFRCIVEEEHLCAYRANSCIVMQFLRFNAWGLLACGHCKGPWVLTQEQSWDVRGPRPHLAERHEYFKTCQGFRKYMGLARFLTTETLKRWPNILTGLRYYMELLGNRFKNRFKNHRKFA